MKSKSPCYELSPASINGQNQPIDSLRIEPSRTRLQLFSYHHLETAELESSQDHDVLTLSFLRHRVRIVGKNLRVLAIAIQSRVVECIKTVPSRYTAVEGTEHGFVESVEIESDSDQPAGAGFGNGQ
jgi:hypothetical protein